jgi:hypothetical protein
MPNLKEYVPTAEEIAGSYSAALDSVSVINAEKSESQSDEDWKETLQRNVDHLKIMVAQSYWTSEDLGPLNAAIASGKAKIAAL